MCTHPEVLECLRCKEKKGQSDFSPHAWRQPRNRVCKQCVHPEVLRCLKCGEDKPEDDFSKHAARTPADRFCKACTHASSGQWTCCNCKARLDKELFTTWLAPRKCKTKHNGTQRCNRCMEEAQKAKRELSRDAAAHVQHCR